jgi:hypothetical protein
MSDEGGVIIVKGGSVQLSFDGTLYQKTSDPSVHKHDGRKIVRVQVDDENGQSLFDSDINKDGLRWTITISTK